MHYRTIQIIIVAVALIILYCITYSELSGNKHKKAPQTSANDTVNCQDSSIEFDTSKVYGIDVSHYQRDIDWEKLAECKPLSFAYVRATVGDKGVDNMVRYNVEQARKNGFLVGIYHYFYHFADVQSQFESFDRYYSTLETDLIPMIDVEAVHKRRRGRVYAVAPPKTLCDSVAKFMDLFHKKYPNIMPAIYTGQTFFNDYLSKRFSMYVKWIANYSQTPVLKNDIAYHIWQFTNKGTFCGIKGKVDVNVLTRKDALLLLKKNSDKSFLKADFVPNEKSRYLIPLNQ